MKPSAFLINVSCGGIVNEQDLYQILLNNAIAIAVADVFEQEPLNNHPLFTLNNFIRTLHISGYTDCTVSAIG